MVCLLVCMIVSCCADAQSYFYFENRLTGHAGQPLLYFTFLTVENDGTATAMIRHVTPAGEDLWIEQQLADSSRPGNPPNNDPSRKYLVASGEPYNRMGLADTGFIMPVFVFKKQLVENDSLFLPESVEYLQSGIWVKAETIVQQEKTFGELSRDKPLVSRFFNASDNFYDYLFTIDTRSLNNVEKSVKLYLVVVANTTDASIGLTSKKDLERITETFTSLKDRLGITMIMKKIDGTNFSKSAVETAINTLKPAPADIVVFYYSGHGYRTATDISKYPRISLRTSYQQDVDKNNLLLEDIYNRILKKGARVNIVISDCCNQDIDAPIPVGNEPLRTRAAGDGKLNFDNCKALFFPARPISVLVASAEKNQRAAGNPELGGFFTNFFNAQLLNSLYTSNGDNLWLPMLVKAKERARYQALSAICAAGNVRCVQLAEIRVVPQF